MAPKKNVLTTEKDDSDSDSFRSTTDPGTSPKAQGVPIPPPLPPLILEKVNIQPYITLEEVIAQKSKLRKVSSDSNLKKTLEKAQEKPKVTKTSSAPSKNAPTRTKKVPKVTLNDDQEDLSMDESDASGKGLRLRKKREVPVSDRVLRSSSEVDKVMSEMRQKLADAQEARKKLEDGFKKSKQAQKEFEEKIRWEFQDIEDTRIEQEEALDQTIEEMNGKIKETSRTMNNVLDEHQAIVKHIVDLKKKTIEQEKKIDEITGRAPAASVLPGLPRILPGKWEMPTFSGNDNPMKYLRELEDYWRAMDLQGGQFDYLCNSSLKGTAGDWWRLVKNDVTNFEQFEAAFKRRYWNQNIQDKVRENLRFGWHDAQGNLSRVEYATKKISLAKDLDDAYSTSDIIRSLSRHFGTDVQRSILMSGKLDLNSFLDLLDTFDQAGRVNGPRNFPTLRNTNFERRENNPQSSGGGGNGREDQRNRDSRDFERDDRRPRDQNGQGNNNYRGNNQNNYQRYDNYNYRQYNSGYNNNFSFERPNNGNKQNNNKQNNGGRNNDGRNNGGQNNGGNRNFNDRRDNYNRNFDERRDNRFQNDRRDYDSRRDNRYYEDNRYNRDYDRDNRNYSRNESQDVRRIHQLSQTEQATPESHQENVNPFVNDSGN